MWLESCPSPDPAERPFSIERSLARWSASDRCAAKPVIHMRGREGQEPAKQLRIRRGAGVRVSREASTPGIHAHSQNFALPQFRCGRDVQGRATLLSLLSATSRQPLGLLLRIDSQFGIELHRTLEQGHRARHWGRRPRGLRPTRCHDRESNTDPEYETW